MSNIVKVGIELKLDGPLLKTGLGDARQQFTEFGKHIDDTAGKAGKAFEKPAEHVKRATKAMAGDFKTYSELVQEYSGKNAEIIVRDTFKMMEVKKREHEQYIIQLRQGDEAAAKSHLAKQKAVQEEINSMRLIASQNPKVQKEGAGVGIGMLGIGREIFGELPGIGPMLELVMRSHELGDKIQEIGKKATIGFRIMRDEADHTEQSVMKLGHASSTIGPAIEGVGKKAQIGFQQARAEVPKMDEALQHMKGSAGGVAEAIGGGGEGGGMSSLGIAGAAGAALVGVMALVKGIELGIETAKKITELAREGQEGKDRLQASLAARGYQGENLDKATAYEEQQAKQVAAIYHMRTSEVQKYMATIEGYGQIEATQLKRATILTIAAAKDTGIEIEAMAQRVGRGTDEIGKGFRGLGIPIKDTATGIERLDALQAKFGGSVDTVAKQMQEGTHALDGMQASLHDVVEEMSVDVWHDIGPEVTAFGKEILPLAKDLAYLAGYGLKAAVSGLHDMREEMRMFEGKSGELQNKSLFGTLFDAAVTPITATAAALHHAAKAGQEVIDKKITFEIEAPPPEDPGPTAAMREAAKKRREEDAKAATEAGRKAYADQENLLKESLSRRYLEILNATHDQDGRRSLELAAELAHDNARLANAVRYGQKHGEIDLEIAKKREEIERQSADVTKHIVEASLVQIRTIQSDADIDITNRLTAGTVTEKAAAIERYDTRRAYLQAELGTVEWLRGKENEEYQRLYHDLAQLDASEAARKAQQSAKDTKDEETSANKKIDLAFELERRRLSIKSDGLQKQFKEEDIRHREMLEKIRRDGNDIAQVELENDIHRFNEFKLRTEEQMKFFDETVGSAASNAMNQAKSQFFAPFEKQIANLKNPIATFGLDLAKNLINQGTSRLGKAIGDSMFGADAKQGPESLVMPIDKNVKALDRNTEALNKQISDTSVASDGSLQGGSLTGPIREKSTAQLMDEGMANAHKPLPGEPYNPFNPMDHREDTASLVGPATGDFGTEIPKQSSTEAGRKRAQREADNYAQIEETRRIGEARLAAGNDPIANVEAAQAKYAEQNSFFMSGSRNLANMADSGGRMVGRAAYGAGMAVPDLAMAGVGLVNSGAKEGYEKYRKQAMLDMGIDNSRIAQNPNNKAGDLSEYLGGISLGNYMTDKAFGTVFSKSLKGLSAEERLSERGMKIAEGFGEHAPVAGDAADRASKVAGESGESPRGINEGGKAIEKAAPQFGQLATSLTQFIAKGQTGGAGKGASAALGIGSSVLNMLIPGAGSILGMLGGAMGFAQGRYTGDGNPNDPAGVVHKGEFVFSAPATKRIGVATLDMLHNGYASGGLVKAAGSLTGDNIVHPTSLHINSDEILTERVKGFSGLSKSDLYEVFSSVMAQQRPVAVVNPYTFSESQAMATSDQGHRVM